MPQGRWLIRRIIELKRQTQQIGENSRMNIDSGLFHLLITLRSIPNCNGFAQTEEPRSAVESRLPEIDYSLLSTPLCLDRRAKASGRRRFLRARATKNSALNVLNAVARSSHS
jgi:hypothetical protein